MFTNKQTNKCGCEKSNQYGGFANQGGFASENDMYRYKAMKYHMKIQQKLKEMIANGQRVPAGYEGYLKPFE